MPPWLPQAGYGDFTDENRLTAEQIRKFADWVAQGAPEGSGSRGPTRAPIHRTAGSSARRT